MNFLNNYCNNFFHVFHHFSAVRISWKLPCNWAFSQMVVRVPCRLQLCEYSGLLKYLLKVIVFLFWQITWYWDSSNILFPKMREKYMLQCVCLNFANVLEKHTSVFGCTAILCMPAFQILAKSRLPTKTRISSSFLIITQSNPVIKYGTFC